MGSWYTVSDQHKMVRKAFVFNGLGWPCGFISMSLTKIYKRVLKGKRRGPTNPTNKEEEQSKNKNKDEPTQNWNRQLLRVYQQEGLLMSQSTVPSFTSKERNKKSQHSNDSYLAYYYQTSLKSSVTYNKHPKSVGYSMPLWLWKTIEAIKNVQSCSV